MYVLMTGFATPWFERAVPSLHDEHEMGEDPDKPPKKKENMDKKN